MKIGYACISTDDHNPDLQIQALKKARCKTIYTEKVGGTVCMRPSLERCLKPLNVSDVLVVWKLNRLGRSLPHLVGILGDLKGRGGRFQRLTEALDTDTPTGRLMGHIIGALAECERSLLVERTRVGITAAKRRGVRVGRRPKLITQQVAHARDVINGGESPSNVARLVGVGRSTLYWALREPVCVRHEERRPMGDRVAWQVELAVKPGELEHFRALTAELVEATRGEPGVLSYERFVSADGTVVHVYERYADSAAAVAHLRTFGRTFGGRFVGMVDRKRFTVYGTPSAELRGMLDGFGATSLEPFGGFSQEGTAPLMHAAWPIDAAT